MAPSAVCSTVQALHVCMSLVHGEAPIGWAGLSARTLPFVTLPTGSKTTWGLSKHNGTERGEAEVTRVGVVASTPQHEP